MDMHKHQNWRQAVAEFLGWLLACSLFAFVVLNIVVLQKDTWIVFRVLFILNIFLMLSASPYVINHLGKHAKFSMLFWLLFIRILNAIAIIIEVGVFLYAWGLDAVGLLIAATFLGPLFIGFLYSLVSTPEFCEKKGWRQSARYGRTSQTDHKRE